MQNIDETSPKTVPPLPITPEKPRTDLEQKTLETYLKHMTDFEHDDPVLQRIGERH